MYSNLILIIFEQIYLAYGLTLISTATPGQKKRNDNEEVTSYIPKIWDWITEVHTNDEVGTSIIENYSWRERFFFSEVS